MGEISVADIVFVSFPFPDLSRSKLRPALVLAYAQREDWILCKIASRTLISSLLNALPQVVKISGNVSEIIDKFLPLFQ